MLSGEGNVNGEKTIIGPMSKKSNFTRVAHFFLYISLPLFCTTTTWNFQKLPGYTFYGGIKCCTCSFSFLLFSLSLFSPWLPLAFLIFSPLLQNFTLFLQQKNVSFVFSLSLWLFFSGVELAGLSPYFLFFSVFNSLSLYSKFVGIAINLSLIL